MKMEEFVSDLLHNADLTVLTKKSVRLKYKEHIGKDLSPDEKDKINNLVYKFINEYAAKQRNSDSSSPPSSNHSSPGDKENKGTKVKKIILKGHVIDKQELANVKPLQKSPKSVQKQETLVKTYPRRIRTPRLEFQDVMTAVLDSDNIEDTSDVSDDDVRQNTSQSDSSDDDAKHGEDITEALARLKEGRDKKIQMSQEKKQKFAQKGSSEKGNVLKSLFQNDRSNTQKQQNDEYLSSSSVILISEGESVDKLSDRESPKVKAKRLPVSNIRQNVNKVSSVKAYTGIKVKRNLPKKSHNKLVKKIKDRNQSSVESDSENEGKTPEKIGSKTDSGSEPLKVNKTPETYAGKQLQKGSDKKFDKCKRKRKFNCSSSDSDSDMDIPLAKRRKFFSSGIRERRMSNELKNKSRKSNSEQKVNKKGSSVSKAKTSKKVDTVELNSETNTGETPLAKKFKLNSKGKAKSRINSSDSESSTGDTPLAKKSYKPTKINIHENTINLDSDSSEDDFSPDRKTNTNNKKSVKTSPFDSDSSSDDLPLAKKSNTKRPKSTQCANIDSSTGDTPLSKKSNISNLNSVITICTDTDTSTDELPCARKSLLRNDKPDDSKDDKDSDKEADKTLQELCGVEEKSDFDSDNSSPVKLPDLDRPKEKLKNGTVSSSGEDSPIKKRKGKALPNKSCMDQKSKILIQTDSESEDSEDMPLSKLNRSGDNKHQIMAAESSSSSDDETPLSIVKKGNSNKAQKQKTSAKKSSVDEESKHLKQLRKICRACGMFIRNDRELKNCHTEKQKTERLKEILHQAGMKGQPSLKKAEEIRLKKEAAQLDETNIISSESGRGHRKVRSKYSQRNPSPKKSPRKSPKKLMKNMFQGLKGIVDSDGSESD